MSTSDLPQGFSWGEEIERVSGKASSGENENENAAPRLGAQREHQGSRSDARLFSSPYANSRPYNDGHSEPIRLISDSRGMSSGGRYTQYSYYGVSTHDEAPRQGGYQPRPQPAPEGSAPRRNTRPSAAKPKSAPKKNAHKGKAKKNTRQGAQGQGAQGQYTRQGTPGQGTQGQYPRQGAQGQGAQGQYPRRGAQGQSAQGQHTRQGAQGQGAQGQYPRRGAQGQPPHNGTRGGSASVGRPNTNSKKLKKQKSKLEKQKKEYEKAIQSGTSHIDLAAQGNKRNRTRMKAKIMAAVLVLVLTLLGGAVAFLLLKGIEITSITVDGAKYYTKEQIIGASGINVSDNIVTVRVGEASKKIRTSLPYIGSVSIKRSIDGTVAIEVSDTADKYYVANGGSVLCIDENDKVVDVKKKKVKKNTYAIEGLEQQDYTLGETFVPAGDNGNRQRYEAAKAVCAAIEKAGIEGCRRVNVKNLDEIFVVCKSKVYLIVSADIDLENAMTFAKNVLSDEVASAQISSLEKSTIDLRSEQAKRLIPSVWVE